MSIRVKQALQSAAGAGGAEPGENIEDLFSPYVYEGKSSNVTVTNNIDLATNGGMVFIKRSVQNGYNYYMMDTEKGTQEFTILNSTAYSTSASNVMQSFNSDGFTIGTNPNVNGGGATMMSWTFRKAEKFFDIVQYTGNGSVRNIAHNLGTTVGMMMIKRTDASAPGIVFHRSAGAGKWMDTTNSDTNVMSNVFNDTEPTSTQFTVGTNLNVNSNGGQYVAYIWAHNNGDANFGHTGVEDVVKCSSYTGNGLTDGPEIDLGFEPQFIWFRRIDTSGNWALFDNIRRIRQGHNDEVLLTNNTNAQVDYEALELQPKGFRLIGNSSSAGTPLNVNGGTYSYIAIRRAQMGVPTSADEVFEIAQKTGWKGEDEPTWLAPFQVVDMAIWSITSSSTFPTFFVNRQSESFNTYLNDDTSKYESGETSTLNMNVMNGVGFTTGTSSTQPLWMWARAPTFFDTFCYEGTGLSGRTINHNLYSEPKMVWIKRRDQANSPTAVYFSEMASVYGSAEDKVMFLSSNGGIVDNFSYWNDTAPTDTTLTIGNNSLVNANGGEYVACLFGECEGVSKMGSFYHSGAGSLSFNIGFQPKFLLFKNYGSNGDWMIFDSEQGISRFGNDDYMVINRKVAQITNTNYIYQVWSGGFQLNSAFPPGYTMYYAIAEP
jgi:hypothetical protein